MKKLERMIEKTVADAGAKVMSRIKKSGHMKFLVMLPSGETFNLITASSPKIVEHTLAAVRRDIKRML